MQIAAQMGPNFSNSTRDVNTVEHLNGMMLSNRLKSRGPSLHDQHMYHDGAAGSRVNCNGATTTAGLLSSNLCGHHHHVLLRPRPAQLPAQDGL